MFKYPLGTKRSMLVEESSKYEEMENIRTIVFAESVCLVKEAVEDLISMAYAKLIKHIPDFEQIRTNHQYNEQKA